MQRTNMPKKYMIYGIIVVAAAILIVGFVFWQQKQGQTQAQIVETRDFSCPGMSGFTFKYPVFKGWEVISIQNTNQPDECSILLSDSVLRAHGIMTEVAPQIMVKKLLGRNARGSKLKGNDFELQIGREWQERGYKVIFEGINKGFKDGGIDLIVKKDNVTNLLQCKYWNPKGKLIRENVIHQFFGAIELYKGKNPNEQVEGVIVTTANLSREAKDAARFHNIGITKIHYPYP